MDEKSLKIYAPNLIVIGVDRVFREDYSGRIWERYDPDPVSFHNTIELIHKAEDFYDRLQFPQRSTVPRSFDRSDEGTDAAPYHTMADSRNERQILMKDIEENRGDKGTFIVQVKYRQNSTWQGQVIWAEKNQKQYFRSALELIHLIDSALDEEQTEDSGGRNGNGNAEAGKDGETWGSTEEKGNTEE